jgi:tRNA threonylcarbamoyladenosine biosynthesis protein TsaE
MPATGKSHGSTAPMPRRMLLAELADTEALAARLAGALRPGDAVLLEGPLGAGKTAFARAVLRAAAANPALEVPSPSYTLVQTYETPALRLHHYDLWRLSSPGGLAELGWDEAREDVVLVEWPDRLGHLRPAEALTIILTLAGETARHATLTGWPASRLAALTGD